MMSSRFICDRVLLTKAAAIVLGIGVVITVAVTPLVYSDIQFGALSWCELVFLKAAGAVGAIGAVLLIAGMWIYWIKCDTSSRNTRSIWFFVLLIGFSYGAIPYYIFVYLPTVRQRLREVEMGGFR